MKAPLTWLKEYVDIDLEVDVLASKLALSGTEVERVTEVGVPGDAQNLGCFVVGKVLQCDRHPDADRLSVCSVEVGDGQPRTIVCGAPNVAVGQTVAAVLPGGTLPGGMVIKEAKLRGVPSSGMLLSEAELGLAAKSGGIMVLPDEWQAGELLNDRFSITDMVLEVEVTPNRPDCLCVLGVAREIAAVTGRALRQPVARPYTPAARQAQEDISIEVHAPELCPRYAGRVIRGVTVGESPLWLKARLTHAGMRPVNNAVDVSNYVMLGLGQPSHAFDLSTIKGGKIVVRRARTGETITTLDGQDRVLTEEMLVIADAGDASVIAGIMGGVESEITSTTTDILLEVANFSGTSLMRTSGALGLRSESSTRYEKGLDPEAIDAALDTVCGLLADLCGGTVSQGTVDVRVAARPHKVIKLREQRVAKVLGAAVEKQRAADILRSLGCGVTIEADGLSGEVPSFRGDLDREIDLVEEVARINGLENIPETLPSRSSGRGGLTRRQKVARRIDDLLEGAGLVGIINYSFTDRRWPDQLRLAADDSRREAVVITNPLSVDQTVMRTMLLPGLLSTAQRNLAVRQEQIPLFERGRTYLPAGQMLPEEPERIGILVAGPWEEQSWLKSGVANGFFLVKGLVERLAQALSVPLQFAPGSEAFLHPGRSAAIQLASGRVIGWLGEVHPLVVEAYDLRGTVSAAELDVEGLLAEMPDVITFRDLLEYPPVEQDIALAVDAGLSAASVVESVRRAGGSLLEDVKVFDLYEGSQVAEGKESIALRLSFRAADRTLSEEEVNRLRSDMLKKVAAETGAGLRS